MICIIITSVLNTRLDLNQFVKISDILNEAAFDKALCESSMKKAVAFGFWKNVCGKKFFDFSYPYDVKGKTLFVAVKNPQVLQELMFCKKEIISKLSAYFLPLNITIEDIRFDYKNWRRVVLSSSYLEGDENTRDIFDDELDEVSLSINEKVELSKVTDTISNFPFLDANQKERYSKNIVNSIKAKKLRK